MIRIGKVTTMTIRLSSPGPIITSSRPHAKSQLAIHDLTISRWAILFLTLSHKHMLLLACHNHNTTTVNRSMDVKET
jgi:hypothetical protein